LVESPISAVILYILWEDDIAFLLGCCFEVKTLALMAAASFFLAWETSQVFKTCEVSSGGKKDIADSRFPAPENQ